jgi:hypothetical protein
LLITIIITKATGMKKVQAEEKRTAAKACEFSVLL